MSADPRWLSRLRTALVFGAFALLLVPGALTAREHAWPWTDWLPCLTIDFENDSGLAATYALDLPNITSEPWFVGCIHGVNERTESHWVTDSHVRWMHPIDDIGAHGGEISLSGAEMEIRVTLRDESATELVTSAILRADHHLECCITPDKQLITRTGTHGWLGPIDWD